MTLEEEIYVRLLTLPTAERMHWSEQLDILGMDPDSDLYRERTHYPKFCAVYAIYCANMLREANNVSYQSI